MYLPLKRLFALLLVFTAALAAVAQPATKAISAVAVVTLGDIKQYEKFEVALALSRDFTASGRNGNPYDPEDVSVAGYFTSPSGKSYPVRYGFYYQDYVIRPQYLPANDARYWDGSAGTAHPWRIRFAPDEPGTWRYVVRVDFRDSTSQTLPARTFTCVASANPGFLKVAGNHRNFIFDSGKSFFAIGSNVDYWGGAIKIPSVLTAVNPKSIMRCGPVATPLLNPPKSAQSAFSTYTFAAYDQVFKELQRNGGNFARVWMHEYNWDIETDTATLGNYESSQRKMYDFDRMLTSAQAHDIYLHLSLLDGIRLWNYGTNTRWRAFPYKTVLGLRDTVSLDFFTDARARKFFKNRIRYVVARWGYSPTIASYELVNEGDFTNAGTVFLNHYRANFPTLVDWTHEMAAYLKQLDSRHMQTLAYGPENTIEFFRDYPELFDYSTNHFYGSSFNMELQKNYMAQLKTATHHKPYQLQEFDYAPYLNTEYQSKFHSTHWATAFSGAFGVALELSAFANIHNPCWPAYTYYRPLARFLAATRFSSAAENFPIGNSTAATRELYGPDYLAKLAADHELFTKIPTSTDSAYNPAYYSPCDRECPPGWPGSTGVAPQHNVNNLDANDFNQPQYLVSGITVVDRRTGSTANNALVEVFGLKNQKAITGWVHNKTHYWYNLPHRSTPCDPRTNPDCIVPQCLACYVNPKLSQAPGIGKPTPGPNTITPLRGQQLVIDVDCPGTYRVRWFYTQPGLDVDKNGILDDGGFLPALEQAAVPATNGQLTIAVPPLVALGADGPATGPDYAFFITSNNGCAVAP